MIKMHRNIRLTLKYFIWTFRGFKETFFVWRIISVCTTFTTTWRILLKNSIKQKSFLLASVRLFPQISRRQQPLTLHIKIKFDNYWMVIHSWKSHRIEIWTSISWKAEDLKFLSRIWYKLSYILPQSPPALKRNK